MFATVIIVLPSQFTGGAAHLSHSGLSKVLDCSPSSAYETTVLAWYTDVTHEIKPITSGYRLALSYNLLHTTQSLRPALSTNEDLVRKIRRTLLTWKQDAGVSTPEKIIYLLNHHYSQASLNASALKGVDAHKVATLDAVAQGLGFRLGLASVECRLWGPGDDREECRSHHWLKDYGYRYGESERVCEGFKDEEYITMNFFDEYITRDMNFIDLVDLEGNLITEILSYDKRTGLIPVDLRKTVESGPLDEEVYGGYQGNVCRSCTCVSAAPDVLTHLQESGELNQCKQKILCRLSPRALSISAVGYRKTVLVVWPTKEVKR